MEEKMKKLISGILCAVMLLALAACNGGGGGTSNGNSTSSPSGDSGRFPDSAKTKTVLNVQNFPGGIGTEWLRKAAVRFEEANKDKHYEGDKTGVYVNVVASQPDSNSLAGSAYHVIFDERYTSVYSIAKNNTVISLDDIMTEVGADGKSLESKIDPATLEGLKGPDGKYYALPHYEWFPGVTYDKGAFDKNNWYIAKDAANGGAVTNKFGTIYLAKNKEDRSCGPDGVYGTDDDGLPTSLKELLVLCGEIKKKTKDGPFTLTGAHLYYSNYLEEALWAALAGKDELRAVYDLSGSVDVVTGYSETEELFYTGSGIKKPIVETKTINKDNGNLAFESAARYYAVSFIEVLKKEGFFHSDINKTKSHIEAQNSFIYGGTDSQTPPRAFLIEGSYWYNESVEANNFENYSDVTDESEKDARFMSLPTSLDVSATPVATEADAIKPSLIDGAVAYAYINAKYKNETGVIDAYKDFLKFLYSDAELRAFTAMTGVTRPIDYTLSTAEYNGLSVYQQKVYELSRKSDVLYFSSANPVFKANQSALKVHFSARIMQPKINNVQYESCYQALAANKTAAQIFDATKFTSEEWTRILNNQG